MLPFLEAKFESSVLRVVRPQANTEVGIDPGSENVLREENKIDGISYNVM